MSKQDLTQYSDDELSMIVFNDEGLYSMRGDENAIRMAIEELYEYTDMQLRVLLNDIDDDLLDEGTHL